MDIWAWVAAERTRRGWSQSELARRAGVSSQLISAGEKGGKPRPSGETLIALARAFGVTVDEMQAAATLGNPVDRAEARRAAFAALRELGISPEQLDALQAVAGGLEPEDWWMLVDRARRNLERRERQKQRHNLPRPDPPPLTGRAVV